MIAYGYTLYRRYSKRRRSHVYYAQFRDGKSGNRLPGRSTGHTSKAQARRWCEQQLRDGYYVAEGEMRFSEYAKDWWVWGKCPYITRKLDKEQSFSRGTAQSYRLNLHNYILPFFGDHKLNRITMEIVEHFLHELRLVRKPDGRPLSGKSVNNIISTLRVMLDRATDLGYIPRNPARRVNISATFNQTVRQSLTREEGLKVLDCASGAWRNTRYYALNLVAAVCGLRLGECRGLQQRHIGNEQLEIVQSWSDKAGLQEPKCASARVVPLPTDVERLLREVVGESPYSDDPDAFVFHGIEPYKPMDNRTVTLVLYEVFKSVGIDDQQRRERNITFHSWRHYFVTNMRGRVPDPILKAVIGHRGTTVTDQYTHIGPERFEEVRRVQKELYPVLPLGTVAVCPNV